MADWHAAIIAAVSIAALSAQADASDVSLSAREGALELQGTLLGFDGAFYRLETEYGEITVDAAGVICNGDGCPDLEAYVPEIVISGAASVGTSVLPALIETFASRRDYLLSRRTDDGRSTIYEFRDDAGARRLGVFTIRSSTSAEGFADLIADEADLALSLREVSPDEAELARQAGRGDLREPGRSRILGLDGLVPIVAVSNPTKSISIDQLRGIAEGTIGNWSDVSEVMSGPITLHLRSPSSGVTQAFQQKVLATFDNAFPETTILHDSDESLSAAVSDDPGALGIALHSQAGNAQPLSLSGPCGAISRADEMSLKTEDYPLTAPIFLYRPARRLPPFAREFLDYATSPAAQPVIDRAGYVDQFPRAIPIASQGERFANAILRSDPDVTLAELRRMMASLDGKARLSTSFRFEGGSSTLDAQSRSNVALLAAALERGVFDGRTLLFAGFSDGRGPRGINRRLALTRAEAVRDAVRTAARSVDPDRLLVETAAFGETMPMACDETDWGRQVNRRVEVWLE